MSWEERLDRLLIQVRQSNDQSKPYPTNAVASSMASALLLVLQRRGTGELL